MDVEELLRATGQEWQAPPVPPLDAERALARQAQRRHARVAVATTAAVLIAGAVGFASWPKGIPATPVIATPTVAVTSVTAPVGESPTSAPADHVTQSPNEPTLGGPVWRTVDELTRRAQTTAAAHGYGATRISAEAVLTDLDKAEQLLDIGHSEPVVDNVVWVIQLRGTFICRDCSWPSGGSAPRGTAMHLVIPAKYLLAADHDAAGNVFGISDTPVDLSRLGTVLELDLGQFAVPQLDEAVPQTGPSSSGR